MSELPCGLPNFAIKSVGAGVKALDRARASDDHVYRETLYNQNAFSSQQSLHQIWLLTYLKSDFFSLTVDI